MKYSTFNDTRGRWVCSTAGEPRVGENTSFVKPFTKSTSKIPPLAHRQTWTCTDPETWNDLYQLGGGKKIQAHEVLQDAGYSEHTSLLENQVIAKMSSRIPTLVFNSGFNAGYPVAESCFNSGSSNPEVSVFECSTPHNSSRCYTMHRWSGRTGDEFTHGEQCNKE